MLFVTHQASISSFLCRIMLLLLIGFPIDQGGFPSVSAWGWLWCGAGIFAMLRISPGCIAAGHPHLAWRLWLARDSLPGPVLLADRGFPARLRDDRLLLGLWRQVGQALAINFASGFDTDGKEALAPYHTAIRCDII